MTLASILLASSVLAAEPLGPGDYIRSLQHDGRSRSYIVHVPLRYDAKQPRPVILAFHGALNNARQMIGFCGLSEKADQEGFIVVYPNGTGRLRRVLTWNGGNCCMYARRNNVDDVGFTRCLLDDLATVVNVDAKRIFATGVSNGGILCYRLASELSDRIAAIAPVAGTMDMATCNPKRAVSVMHFHGTDDRFVPFNGGTTRASLRRVEFLSVRYSIQEWVKANGCPEIPVVTVEPTKCEDGTTVQRETYGAGKDGAEVVLYVINGGGHTWPGRDPEVRLNGKSTKNISANDLMWEFFKRHPMK